MYVFLMLILFLCFIFYAELFTCVISLFFFKFQNLIRERERERNDVEVGGREGREGLGGVWGRETTFKIYLMKLFFDKKVSHQPNMQISNSMKQ